MFPSTSFRTCPRCEDSLVSADDIGEGVLSCACGVIFVTQVACQRLLHWLGIAEQTWQMLLQEGHRGPTCACGTWMQTTSMKGVTVDGCLLCGGLLLDPGELRRLTGLAENPRPRHEVSTEPYPSPYPAASGVGDAIDVHDDGDGFSQDLGALGRVYLPARDATLNFVEGRAYQLLQVKSQFGGEWFGMPVNQPCQWTVANGRETGGIVSDNESLLGQLLAFSSKSWLTSRYLLSDGRQNPMLLLRRRTRALALSSLDVCFADDETLIGRVTRGVVGLSLEIQDAHGVALLHLKKRLGDIWGFTVLDTEGKKCGDISRGFANIEMDHSLLGGLSMDRSLRRDDFHLVIDDEVSSEHRVLLIASLFLVAITPTFGMSP